LHPPNTGRDPSFTLAAGGSSVIKVLFSYNFHAHDLADENFAALYAQRRLAGTRAGCSPDGPEIDLNPYRV
jgi:hypothetical protein